MNNKWASAARLVVSNACRDGGPVRLRLDCVDVLEAFCLARDASTRARTQRDDSGAAAASGSSSDPPPPSSSSDAFWSSFEQLVAGADRSSDGLPLTLTRELAGSDPSGGVERAIERRPHRVGRSLA
eukprot:GHVU01132051.1.p1 GENE.GHVU01132051.1~~GHVU01132051.1.p1  ORF type:complete len:127 (+),score=25.51 GHVU01132051.1:473-853(+)